MYVYSVLRYRHRIAIKWKSTTEYTCKLTLTCSEARFYCSRAISVFQTYTYLKRQPEGEEHPGRDRQCQTVPGRSWRSLRMLQRMPHFGYCTRVTPGYEVDVSVAHDQNQGAGSINGTEHEQLNRSRD